VRVHERGNRLFAFDTHAHLGLYIADDVFREGGFLTESGRHLYFQERSTRDIVLADVDARQSLALPGLNAPGVDRDLHDVSPDGRWVLVGGVGTGGPFTSTSQLALYDASSASLRYVPLPGIGDTVMPTAGVPRRCRISADGRYIAGEWELAGSGGWLERRLRVYDRTAGALLPLPGGPIQTWSTVVIR
jgi:hypothetical protein